MIAQLNIGVVHRHLFAWIGTSDISRFTRIGHSLRDTNWIKVFIQKCQTVSMVWTEMCTMLASESTGGSEKSILRQAWQPITARFDMAPCGRVQHRHHYHTPHAMSVMCQPRPCRWSAGTQCTPLPRAHSSCCCIKLRRPTWHVGDWPKVADCELRAKLETIISFWNSKTRTRNINDNR